MSLLKMYEVQANFGTNEVLKGINLDINVGTKMGLIGVNGCGKSTLLKIIAGAIKPTKGRIQTLKPDLRIKYLKQYPQFTALTVYEELETEFEQIKRLEQQLHTIEASLTRHSDNQVLAQYGLLQDKFQRLGGYTYHSTIAKALHLVGWDEKYYSLKVEDLSGGEKSRLELARLLLDEPDILLLDEPTNHIDVEGMQWLEEFVANYSGAIVVVSHDRYFLDRVVAEIVELELGKAYYYPTNYTGYKKLKAERLEAQAELFKQQQKKMKHLNEIVNERMNWFAKSLRTKAKDGSVLRREEKHHMRTVGAKQARFAKAKLAELERLKERSVKRPYEHRKLTVDFGQSIDSGNELFIAKAMGKRYGNRTLFENVDLVVPTGRRIALLGANGSGKSTFLRMLLSTEDVTEGCLQLGKSVSPMYFDQELGDLDLSHTAVQELLATADIKLSEARFLLACHQIYGDKANRKLINLSLGERVRVALTKLLIGEANLLILDEPTNHLDIPSRESVEGALQTYPGSILFVSHDRYFVKEVADAIMYIEDQQIHYYSGDYVSFNAWQQDSKQAAATSDPKRHRYLKQRIMQLEMTLSHLANQLQESAHEAEKKQLEEQLRTNYQELSQMQQELTNLTN